MDTTPYWLDTAALPRFPRPERDVQVDVAIIGGGIMGITAAYLLKQAGKKVALIERARCARADTGHTTAHVTAVTDLRLQEIARAFGRDAAKAVWDAGSAAIDQIVANVRAEDLACEFRWVPGYLHVPLVDATGHHREVLEREATFAQEIGIAAEFVESVPAFDLPGVKFPHQALFHPRKYLAGLLQKIPGRGSHVFEECAATGVENGPRVVRAGAHRIECAHVVMATHTPHIGAGDAWGATLFQSKLALYTTYVIGARIPAGKFPEASFWDTSDPYFYLRIERDQDDDYAIFGGSDHKTGQHPDTPAAYRALEEQFRRFVPDALVEHRWSGQVIETVDGLPFIGELVPGQFGATGFAGNGMTFGTLGAMMATDAILGRKNPWTDLFSPARKKLLGDAWTFVKENKDYPYYMLRDWLGGTEGKTLRSLRRGQGKILHLDGRKVAAYRDDSGEVTLCSPVCKHLKCIVAWNEAERTWDCPCHGSRYKPSGEVIAGPAEAPLDRLPPRGE